MKTNLTLLLSTSSMLMWIGTPQVSADPLPNLPELVTIAPEHVFAPQGFDNNDNGQITIAGDMPSTCFKAGPATAQVDPARKTILIHNQGYFYPDCWCLQVLVPYVKTIDLGIIPSGTYKVLAEQDNGERRQKGVFSVSVSTNSGPDDHLYALVDDTKIDLQEAGTPRTLTLSGLLTSSCMELSEIKVLNRAPNVIEVLPLVTIQNLENCDAEKRFFTKKVTLNPPWKGATPVHVRSLNGQALNKVVKF